MAALRRRFADLLGRLGASADAAHLFDRLHAAYAAPDRAYHDTRHLTDCLAELDGAPDLGADRDLAEAALWFHDVVYDARSSDNEERSAAWAAQELEAAGVSPRATAEVARLIRLTRHSEPTPDPTGRLVCDIDLVVLGRDPAGFAEFERGIRKEYAWVPELVYRAGRGQVLQALLARRSIYQTDHFQRRYEAAARRNLEALIARLGQAGTSGS